jgi:DNA polymerase III subunit epsilon
MDLETTGVQVAVDRVVQIATATIAPDGCVSTWSSLVNPGQPIPSSATAVHGITDARVATAPTFAELAPAVHRLLSGADLTGYNVDRFDRRLLAAEFGRAGLPDPMAGARVIDAYTILVRQEPRTLDAALRFYGMDESCADRQAHDAISDVEASVAVLVGQMQAYPDLPRSVEALDAWLHPRDPNWIDQDGKLLWCGDVATVGFGAQSGAPLADLASNDRGFLEWMLRKDFSDEVKGIVRAALDGRLPVREG